MKKLLAIILSITMLFSVLAINAFADDVPKVTLITNEGSPVAEGVHTYLTVRFDNFSSIKGMDIVITADGATLGEVDVTNLPELTDGDNFTEVNTDTTHEIRIVDLTAFSSGKLTFEVTAPKESALITVEGKYADSGTTLFSITTEAGNLEVKKEVVSVPVVVPDNTEANEEGLYELPVSNFVADTAKQFVPYGSVYKEVGDEIIFAKKDTDGNFIADSTYSVNSFDIPENGITTFGVSENTTDSNAIRFGNYSQYETEPEFHGTMVFEGDWLALKNYYIKNGYSVQEFIQKIYENFDETLEKNTNKTFVYYNVPDENGVTTRVNVYKFKQKNHMWQGTNGDKDVLEYALRLTGVKDGETYTAVAYSELSDVPTISANVKSEKRPDAAAE